MSLGMSANTRLRKHLELLCVASQKLCDTLKSQERNMAIRKLHRRSAGIVCEQPTLRLTEDSLALILDHVAPVPRHFDYSRSRDIQTLCSLRLVDRYLSVLVSRWLFACIGIGKVHDPGPILPSFVASHLESSPLIGIRGSGCFTTPYWSRFASNVRPFISQLTLRLIYVPLDPEDIMSFHEAMSVLAPHVHDLTLDFEGSSQDLSRALTVVQYSFTELNSIQMVHSRIVDSNYTLQACWACIGSLRSVSLYDCNVSFGVITGFLAAMRNVTHITVQRCIPWDNADGAVWLGLEEDRQYQGLDIEDTIDDGYWFIKTMIYRYKRVIF
ncbi:hypothetical protein FRC16_002712 [Serendipita sp. 398]|nr:hypothetical protein FRC16_002712 [Serendipita sp. 398]